MLLWWHTSAEMVLVAVCSQVAATARLALKQLFFSQPDSLQHDQWWLLHYELVEFV